MSNTIRLKTKVTEDSDKYLKINLNQDFDFLEVLSLNITQEDVYRTFSSDYGVIVGRVIVNNGFGVPNAKVSVFIPLDEVDKNDSVIKNLYPYTLLTDTNSDGIRYNVLTKDSVSDNNCFTPVGTFPSKRQVLDNEEYSKIYTKYYKFTTTTNHAGDFMLFGVPLGYQTVHVDADISDIGIISQRPYDLINQGMDEKKFDSSTKFTGGKNLNKLIQIKSENLGAYVQPFWGDTENFEIGITRLDIDLNYEVIPSAIFVGSIFGDNDKNSVNKNCRPRNSLGILGEQVSGKGTVKMIRKNINNQIEQFDVEDGELIDENGNWAYQIPMNLDYMVTSEEGDLILSEDSSKGVPTRASVRFSIGMDNTGGEGRLRTRARFLVPNNPKNQTEIDYEFGSATKNSSFRELHWNKIYTVSNFVSRYYRNNIFTTSLTRRAIGVKDIDYGGKNPFPFNRLNTETNPLFFIICLIMYIIIFILYMLNRFILPLINFVLSAINVILGALCSIMNVIARAFRTLWINIGWEPRNCTIEYIPCISVKCPFDDSSIFAPGCDGKSSLYFVQDTFNAMGTVTSSSGVVVPYPDYYLNDKHGHTSGIDCGLGDCIAFEMAKALSLFQFDFYNDWINGTLFGFLLKYKRRSSGVERFCEYDCEDIGAGGADGNRNGISDNGCVSAYLGDTGIPVLGAKNTQDATMAIGINEGVIKQVTKRIKEGDYEFVKKELFYAATDKKANFRMFATDIVSLGSVFDCDWQGIPKIQRYLTPSTYQLPPDIQELSDDKKSIQTGGMVSLGGNTCGLFFSIDCFGLHVDKRQMLNIRHICEIGVEGDEAKYDNKTDRLFSQANCILDVDDIDDGGGKYFRDVFYGLNSSTNPTLGVTTLTIPAGGFSTNFNTDKTKLGNYDYTSDNGSDYNKFRDYGPVPFLVNPYNGLPFPKDLQYIQNKKSYYFYFGIENGVTSLDKMNKKYFTDCSRVIRDEIIIESSSTSTITNTGTITFYFVGGVGKFSYEVIQLDANGNPLTYYKTGTIGGSNISITLTGLEFGKYIIKGVDSVGTPVSDYVTVDGPVSLYCSVSLFANATTTKTNDGKIVINDAGGGDTNLSYNVKDKTDKIIVPDTKLNATPTIISGLAVDTTKGYTVTVFDTSTPPNQCITTGITIDGISVIDLKVTKKDITCYGGFDGEINLNIIGGKQPLNIKVIGINNSYASQSATNKGLKLGDYEITVVDNLGSSAKASVQLIHEHPEMEIQASNDFIKQCDPNKYILPFYIKKGFSSGNVTVQYALDNNGNNWVDYVVNYNDPNTPVYVEINRADMQNGIFIRLRTSDSKCFSEEIFYQRQQMELPPKILSIKQVNIPQCTPNEGKLVFTISHLEIGYQFRAPYTIEYKTLMVLGTNIWSQTKTIEHYSGGVEIISEAPQKAFFDTTKADKVIIAVKIKDNKGCIFPTNSNDWQYFEFKIPNAPLEAKVTKTQTGKDANGQLLYTYVIDATGGIAPYTEKGKSLPRTISNIKEAIYVATVVDSSKCTNTIVV